MDKRKQLLKSNYTIAPSFYQEDEYPLKEPLKLMSKGTQLLNTISKEVSPNCCFNSIGDYSKG